MKSLRKADIRPVLHRSSLTIPCRFSTTVPCGILVFRRRGRGATTIEPFPDVGVSPTREHWIRSPRNSRIACPPTRSPASDGRVPDVALVPPSLTRPSVEIFSSVNTPPHVVPPAGAFPHVAQGPPCSAARFHPPVKFSENVYSRVLPFSAARRSSVCPGSTMVTPRSLGSETVCITRPTSARSCRLLIPSRSSAATAVIATAGARRGSDVSALRQLQHAHHVVGPYLLHRRRKASRPEALVARVTSMNFFCTGEHSSSSTIPSMLPYSARRMLP